MSDNNLIQAFGLCFSSAGYFYPVTVQKLECFEDSQFMVQLFPLLSHKIKSIKNRYSHS